MNINETQDYFKSKISKTLKDGIQSFYSQARNKSPKTFDFFLSLTSLHIDKTGIEELVQLQEEDQRVCIRGLVLDTGSNFFYKGGHFQ